MPDALLHLNSALLFPGCSLLFLTEKVHFLVIQLLFKFDFGHATPKPVSWTIDLSKPFIFDHSAVLKDSFADVDDTRQWGPHVSLFSSLLSHLSVSSLFSSARRRE